MPNYQVTVKRYTLTASAGTLKLCGKYYFIDLKGLFCEGGPGPQTSTGALTTTARP